MEKSEKTFPKQSKWKSQLRPPKKMSKITTCDFRRNAYSHPTKPIFDIFISILCLTLTFSANQAISDIGSKTPKIAQIYKPNH